MRRYRKIEAKKTVVNEKFTTRTPMNEAEQWAVGGVPVTVFELTNDGRVTFSSVHGEREARAYCEGVFRLLGNLSNLKFVGVSCHCRNGRVAETFGYDRLGNIRDCYQAAQLSRCIFTLARTDRAEYSGNIENKRSAKPKEYPIFS